MKLRHILIAAGVLAVSGLSLIGGCYARPYEEQMAVVVLPDSSVHFVKSHGTPGDERTQGDDSGQVYSKRVIIPTEQRTMGRGPFNYTFIPSVQPVMTTRKSVFRSWTEPAQDAKDAKNLAFSFESKDSINFSAGASILCRVDYPDTAKYRYRYSGKPLEVTVDSDVRKTLQSMLNQRFAKLSFQSPDYSKEPKDCLNQIVPIFDEAFAEARALQGDGHHHRLLREHRRAPAQQPRKPAQARPHLHPADPRPRGRPAQPREPGPQPDEGDDGRGRPRGGGHPVRG